MMTVLRHGVFFDEDDVGARLTSSALRRRRGHPTQMFSGPGKLCRAAVARLRRNTRPVIPDFVSVTIDRWHLATTIVTNPQSDAHDHRDQPGGGEHLFRTVHVVDRAVLGFNTVNM
jgi:hypothetical protein